VKLPPAYKTAAVEAAGQAIAAHSSDKILTMALAVVERFEADGWCLVPPGGPEWDIAQYDGTGDA
jgi:hypothetical protein